MRRRHKALHAAHERAQLVRSVPHVQRDRGFPGAQPCPVRPIPLHLRRNQVRTVFCIMTCFISQSDFYQKSPRSGAAKRGETWCVWAGTHTAFALLWAQDEQWQTLFTLSCDEGSSFFREQSKGCCYKVRVSSIICSGSASSAEQQKRVASHVTANTFVWHQKIGAKSERFNFILISSELSLSSGNVWGFFFYVIWLLLILCRGQNEIIRIKPIFRYVSNTKSLNNANSDAFKFAPLPSL